MYWLQAFGVLKGRFRCLRGLRVHLEHVTPIVTACLVLHNICVDMEDTWHEPVRLPRPTDGPPILFMNNSITRIVEYKYSERTVFIFINTLQED